MADTAISGLTTYFNAVKASEAKSERKQQLSNLVTHLMAADAATFKAGKPELDRLVRAVVADERDSRDCTTRANASRERRGLRSVGGCGVYLRAVWTGDLKSRVDKRLEAVEAQLENVGDANTAFDVLRQRNQLKAIARELSQL